MAQQKSNNLKVSRIKISNILGIESLEFAPSPVGLTVVRGKNGSGKTSVIESLRTAFNGAHDATLLRTGAQKGEVVLVLDDGTEIKKTVDENSADVRVNHPEIGPVSRYGSFLKKLADTLSLNPIEFLTASPKDRVNLLLQAIPMRITADQIGFVPQIALSGVDLGKHALESFSQIHKNLFEYRRGVNRAEKEKRATVSQLTETLPADPDGGNWSDVFDQRQKELGALRLAAQEKTSAIRADYASIVDAANKVYMETSAQLERELSEQIEKLRADTEIARKYAQEKRDGQISCAEKNRDESLAHEKEQYDPRNQELVAAISEAKTMIEQHAKTEKTREFIAQLTTEADHLEKQSKSFTSALSQLEVLKASFLQKLPISGVEIRDDDIFIGDIPFDRVNTARKVEIAIEAAILRSGSLPLIVCDGIEALDSETFRIFRDKIEQRGVQCIVARVDDSEFGIETKGAA
jgi:flagellar biosynthesis GTPase FlhF